jgi:excisionase family DNA binding protein
MATAARSPGATLTPKQVAHALQVKPRTVRRWCREGTLPTAKKVGRQWRIPRSEVQKYTEPAR